MSLDADRCAQLHNKLMRIGWEGIGQPFEAAPFATFWDEYESRRHEIQAMASDETIAFYKKALVLKRSEWSLDLPFQNMFYFVQGLTQPWSEFNWEAVRHLNQDGQRARYIMLYGATSLQSHYAGILLDQDTGKAIMQSSLWSSRWDDPSLPWLPLADLLTAYLDIVEVEKTVAGDFKSGDNNRHFRKADPQYPWILQSYSEAILAGAITSFDRLIAAIEARMPANNDGAPQTDPRPLATNEALNAGGFPPSPSFARSFLTTAKRPKNPSLLFIAPGITLPTTASLATQPFKEISEQFPHPGSRPGRHLDIPPNEDPLFPPLLIFPSSPESEPRSPNNEDQPSDPPFQYPFSTLPTTSLPSGLYLDTCAPWSATPHEDASVFLLPFALGPNGHAMYNDGAHIDPPSRWSLYQTRMNPFIIGHRTQLRLILDSWTGMVERGEWEVNGQGVAGGIGRFREADQDDQRARRYVAALHW